MVCLLELDGKPETDPLTARILDNLNGNRIAKVPKHVEDMLGLGRHFKDQYEANKFFRDPTRINTEMENVVKALLPPLS